MPLDIEAVLRAGIVLSVVTLLVLIWAIVDLWRRPSLPAVSYGGVELAQRRLRWVWLLVLLGTLTIGVTENPMVHQTLNRQEPELLEGDPQTRTVSVSVPLPFYRYERERTYVDELLAREHVTRSFLIPKSLLSALLAYLLLVRVWNPESRWALRILHGRKRGRDA